MVGLYAPDAREPQCCEGYPSFGALYTGTNSLGPHSQAKETWTASAYLTVRLWRAVSFTAILSFYRSSG